MYYRTFLLQVILLWNIFSIDKINPIEIKGNLPDPLLVSRILSNFFQPILPFLPMDSPAYRTSKKTTLNKAVKDKIADLKNFLQDNDVNDANDNIIFEDKDDTTIIEFLPKTDPTGKSKTSEDDVSKNNLKKYKILKEKISEALTKEKVSDKTKQLVTKTLDDMIKTLLGRQCRWKRNLRADEFEETISLANKWNNKFLLFSKLLGKLISGKKTKRNDIPDFFDNMQLLFDSVANDVELISKKYKIMCEFVPKHDNVNALRNTWDDTDIEKDRCGNLIICSNELEEFIFNFYVTLNETSLKVIKDYTEMYIRDVNASDLEEKESIIKLFNKASENLEGPIQEVFVKDTTNLKLDPGKRVEENIKFLSNYVKYAVKDVKKIVKKMLESELSSVRDKILTVIMDDIKVNMEVELGNLEREFITKICNDFQICNGKNVGRRQYIETGKNNLYVQVELTLDDDEADMNSFRRVIDKHKARNNDLQLNVTRTTYFNNYTTTKVKN